MNNIMPTGYKAMVAAPHYLATQVGSSVLQQGGNAYDSAVAVSAALGVVYPHMTGIGGDAFFLMYHARDKLVEGLNGSGRAGKHSRSEVYWQLGLNEIPHRGAPLGLRTNMGPRQRRASVREQWNGTRSRASAPVGT